MCGGEWWRLWRFGRCGWHDGALIQVVFGTATDFGQCACLSRDVMSSRCALASGGDGLKRDGPRR